MKRILITTDFSDSSRHTIKFVLNFLKDAKVPCQILLLNTFTLRVTDPQKIILHNDELKNKSKASLEEERALAQKLIQNDLIQIEVASHLGSLNNVVLQLLKKEKFDFVAMGKRKGRHVENMSLMLRQQHCPLLITYLE